MKKLQKARQSFAPNLRLRLGASRKEDPMSRTNVCFALCLYLLICSTAAVVPAAAQHFQQMNGSLSQIAAGRNEAWGLNSSGEIYRFNAKTRKFAQIKIAGMSG